MNALLLQTILLMTIAYFIGAALACGLRRMLARDAEPVRMAPAVVAAPAPETASVVVRKTPVDPLPQYREPPKPVQPAAPPAPAPAPQPVARVAPPVAPKPAPLPLPPQQSGVGRYPASTSNGNRFDDALAGKVAAPPPPAPPPPAAPVTQKSTPVVAPSAPAAAPAMPAPAPSTAEAIAAAAAVAAAAASAAAAKAGATSAAKPVTPPPATPAAPVVAAPAPQKDDLTLIANIDRPLEADLNKLGVTSYRQIAGWLRPDVQRVDQMLGQKNRVERENWIEQAQILALGKDTAYSALVRRGQRPAAVADRPVSEPQPAIAPIAKAAPGVAAPAVPAAPKPAVSAPAAAQAAAAIAAAAAAASAVVAPRAPAQASAPAAAVPPPATSPRVEDRAAFATETRPEAPRPVAPPPPPAAAVSTPSVAVSERDDLQRISGVNGEIERLLAFHNVTRYQHIASWTTADVEKFDNRLGSQGRIARENWVEQAQILSRGGDTAYSREYDRRKSGVSPDAATRPSRLADAIKAHTPGAAATAAAVAAAGTVAQPSTRNDLCGLRSVRSEMYRPVDEATTTAAAAAAAAGSARVVRGSEMDDLKRIRGIGVLIEKKLNSLGVYTYAQIAEWTSADIEAMSQKLDFKGRIERENWVEQARILSSGGQTEFSRRVDRGEVDSSKKPV